MTARIDTAALVAAYTETKSLRLAAERCGCDRRTATKRLRAAGVEIAPPGGHGGDNLTPAGRDRVRAAAVAAGQRSRAEALQRHADLVEAIRAGLAARKSYRAIAEDLGVGRWRVEKLARAAGLTGGAPKPVPLPSAPSRPADGLAVERREPLRRPQADVRPLPPRRHPVGVGPAPRTCQWIAGEPTGDDSCKCGAETLPGRPYCLEHELRAWRVGTAAAVDGRRPVSRRWT